MGMEQYVVGNPFSRFATSCSVNRRYGNEVRIDDESCSDIGAVHYRFLFVFVCVFFAFVFVLTYK